MRGMWLNLWIGAMAFHLSPILANVAVAQEVRQAQSGFSDVPATYWAAPFIQALATRGIVGGFPDGRFHSDQPVSRAQFAALLHQAFSQPAVRATVVFQDVPNSHWAAPAIHQAYTSGFMSGFPGNQSSPDDPISRTEVLVSLTNGLGYTPQTLAEFSLQVYQDAAQIPDYALSSIGAATEHQLVVNYPDPTRLNPNRSATRAEVAAFIYQALFSQGRVPPIPSPNIVCTNRMVTTYQQQLMNGKVRALEALIACADMEVLIASGRPALPVLKAGVQDPSNVVQVSAMFALGQIVANDPSLATEIVPVLITTLENLTEDKEVRSSAAEALGVIGKKLKLILTNGEPLDENTESLFLAIVTALEKTLRGEIAQSSSKPSDCDRTCRQRVLVSPLFLSAAGALEDVADRGYVCDTLGGCETPSCGAQPSQPGSPLAIAVNDQLARNPPVACRFIRFWFCP